MMDLLKRYDKWTLERIGRHVLYWLSWSLFYILINYTSNEQQTLRQWMTFEAVVLPIKVAFTYSVAYFIMPKFLYTKEVLLFIFSTFLSVIFFGYLLFLVYSKIVDPQIMGGIPHYKTGQFIYKGIELIYIASLFIGFKFFQNYQYEQKRNQLLLKEKTEAELKYLKNQIQPHFLFNTLNNIYGMVLSNDDKASETIVEFSNLLSYMLYESNVPNVPINKELLYLESFIELEKIRYGKRLDLSYEKGHVDEKLTIAPLLLIPFVENAFKHGPTKEKGKSFIQIKIQVNENQLYFQVKNSYQVNSQEHGIKSGIGLQNVKKRLALIYPNAHELKMEKTEVFDLYLTIDLS